MTEPDLTVLAKLRAEVPDALVSKLPKGKEDKAKRQRCATCNGYHDPSMIHLDYVGHAALTAILLDADPTWTWAPVATDEHGRPLLDRNASGQPIGLWIELTIGGMTRLGYGSVEPGKHDAVKELIGDALRNAAMRFGVALSLWHKGGDLPAPETSAAVGTGEGSAAAEPTRTATVPPRTEDQQYADLLAELERLLVGVAADRATAAREYAGGGIANARTAINRLKAEQRAAS